jgi:hypothetical protein
LTTHFEKHEEYYKKIKADIALASFLKNKFSGKSIFFNSGADSRELKDYIDLYEFGSIEEGYHQLMNELCNLTIEAISLVLSENDDTENIFITGGFSKNELFLHLITEAFPSKKVYTSEIANGSALGAALVISGTKPLLNLGLTECRI